MLFPTIDFAVFFLVVFTGSWMLRPHRVPWRLFILASSIYFYGYWSWRLVPLLLGTVVVNWAFGLAVHAALAPDGSKTPRSRALVAAAVVIDLGVLGYFKYAEFFEGAIAGRLQELGLHVGNPTLSIVLPIGISFFTFQAISYVIDIGRGVWTRPVPLLEFAVYLTFFAHLVAGPIVRASEFIPQIEDVPDPRHVRSAEAFMLIFRGLFKKVVISSYMATVADPVFSLPAQQSRWAVLWGIWAYAIQIYADFSGYTDIAIGVALLLGIRFPENFDAPVPLAVVPGVLAAVAHDLVALAARLPLHPARWQPRQRRVHVPQPHAHHGDRRSVARRQLDLRDLGDHPGRGPRGRTGGQEGVGAARPDRPARLAGRGRCSGSSPSR